MKYLIIIFMVLNFVSPAFAGSMFDGMSEKELAEYEIQVVRKDGKVVGKMNRSQYKVVKIESEEVQEAKKEEMKVLTDAKKYQEKHYSVILHGGVGQDGLRSTYENGFYEVTEKIKPVVGFSGCYTQTTTGVCATVLTNKTGLLGIKKDF